MKLPTIPEVLPLRQITPSLYEAGQRCKARMAWMAFGDKNRLLVHPKAVLGMALHATVEAAHKGILTGATENETSAKARQLFDESVSTRLNQGNPLMRARFPSRATLPFYNLYRERATLIAVDAIPAFGASRTDQRQGGTPSYRGAERGLASRDGLVFGRPDYLDSQSAEVIDYKTGISAADEDNVAESEQRQLRLYAHLASENSISVKKGTIVRADGSKCSIDITGTAAEQEGRIARLLLGRFNELSGRPFDSLASPSIAACKSCPCIPFCVSFWAAATPGWEETCGTHLEGTLTGVQEIGGLGLGKVFTISLDVRRGTIAAGSPLFLQHVPASWMFEDADEFPSIGDSVRVTNARRTSTALPIVARIDRSQTALWCW